MTTILKTNLLLALLGLTFSVNGQGPKLSGGTPFMSNYDNEDYQTSENQHWATLQNKEGFVFFGSNDGVLQFDGKSWDLIPLPNKSVVRSLAMDALGNVYVGGKGEFGKLVGNPQVGYKYQSLSSQLAPDDKHFEDVWRIHVDHTDKVYFQSFLKIFVKTADQLAIVNPKGRFHLSFMVNNQFFVNERGAQGLMQYENGMLVPVLGAKEFANESIYALLPYGSNFMLVATRNNGLFLYNQHSGVLTRPLGWEETSNILAQAKIFSGLKLAQDIYAFGTLNDGLYIIQNGQIMEHINKEKGLIGNTIWSMSLDNNRNLFLSLDNGIAHLMLNSEFRLFEEASGIIGNVLAVGLLQEHLFVGTSFGLFVYNNDKLEFENILGIDGYVWDFLQLGDYIYASTYSGIIRIDGALNVSSLGTEEYVWKVLELKSRPGKFLAGTRDGGILVLSNENGPLEVIGHLKGFDESSRWIVEGKSGDIWVSHYNKGIYRLKFDEELMTIKTIESYGLNEGLPSNTNNYVHSMETETIGFVVGTENGVYVYDEQLDRFKVKSLYNLEWGEGFINQFRPLNDHQAFVQNNKQLGVLSFSEDTSYLDTDNFLPVAPLFCDVIVPIGRNSFFFGTSKGLFHYTASNDNTLKGKFPVAFRSLTIGDSAIQYSDKQPRFPHDENSFTASYVWPEYVDFGEIEYRYRLKGFDAKWSEWSTNNYKEYTTLPEGKYDFLVEARNASGEYGYLEGFSFRIAAPFYNHPMAYFLYLVILALSIWGIVEYNVNRHKKERVKLEAIIDARTSELLAQKDEIQKQASLLEDVNIQKNKIFSIIAHDLRNPLATLKGLTQLLDPEILEKKDLEKFKKNLEDRIDGLSSAMVNLLNWTQTQMEGEVVAFQTFDLIALAEEMTALYDYAAKSKGVRLSHHIPDGTMVTGDKNQVAIILRNLIGNAIKYTKQGEQIAINCAYQSKGHVTVEVYDNGAGMAPETLDGLFSVSTAPSIKGTDGEQGVGLGLFLVREYVEKNGGTIHAESILGSGSKFVFTLPIGPMQRDKQLES